MMASNTTKATYLVLWSVLDLTVSVLLYPQQFHHYQEIFLTDILHYSVSRSMLDLCVLALVRFAFVVGVLFGYLRNTTEGVKRVQSSQSAIVVLAVIMWDFPLVKLLIMYNSVQHYKQVFFGAMLAWCMFASVIFYVNWTLLGTFKSLRHSQSSARSLSVNASGEERRSLLGNRDQTSESRQKAEKKDEDEIEKTLRFATVGRLISYSKPDWPIVFVAFTFLLLSSTAQIFTPWYTGQVIEGIAIKHDHSKFIRSIIYMALFSAASAIAAGIRGGCFTVVIARLNMRIRKCLFASLLKQEIAFFDVTQTGEITSRLTSDTTIMSDTLGLNINVFLRSIVTSAGVCVFMIRLSWQLSLVTVIGLPIILGASHIYGNFYERLSKRIQDCQAKANKVADEVCSSMRTVRSFAGEESERDRYALRLHDTYRLQKTESIAYAAYMWVSELFALSLVVATLYYGGTLVLDNLLSGGKLVSFILYQMQLGYELESIASVYTGLMQATGASEKVFEFIERKPVISNEGKVVSTNLQGRLDFQNVSFAYPSRPDTQVLKDVTFSVAPGEVVALVGPSGGGKTSCISLLEHFYETSAGQVLLDGVPICDYDHHFLHKQISLVGQEPVLYARSIRENIAYGLEVCDMQMVKKASQMANAHQFISELSDQYETEAGEKGVQLSGGQKQRVAIARAMIRNPTILLLDEATSALDAESEHVVQETIYKNLKGRTVIIVAHRLSTVERATRIVVINKGSVVEQGSHKELLQQGGLYSKLVQRQLLGQDIGLSPSQNPLDGEARPRQQDAKQDKSPSKTAPNTRPRSSPVMAAYGSMRTGTVGSPDGHRSSPHDQVFQPNTKVNFRIGSSVDDSIAGSLGC